MKPAGDTRSAMKAFTRGRPGRTYPTDLVALAIFAVLTPLMTHPLAAQSAHAIGNYGDPLLNAWALASNAHKFVTHPLDLFNANIFYPYPATLAYSENLIAVSLWTAPLIWATGNPVLAHNLAVLVSFPLSAFGAYLLVKDFTGSWYGGFVAGMAFGFAHYRFGDLSQLQNLTIQWLPFALLYYTRFFRTATWRNGLLAAFFLSLQMLSTLYHGLYAVIAVALLVLYSALTWHMPGNRARELRTWVRLALTSLGVLVVTALIAIPYNTAKAVVGERTLSDQLGATLQQYVQVTAQSPLGRLIPVMGKDLGATYFPGVVVIGLVVFFFVTQAAARRSSVRYAGETGDWLYYLLLGAVAFVLSLGTALQVTADRPPVFGPLPYVLLHDWVPGFKALRTPARIGPLVILALAVLAGYGAARLARQWRTLALGALAVLLALEYFAAPARVEPIEAGAEVPRIYRWIDANLPADSVVLELPAITSRALWNDPESKERLALQQYFTAYHWRPTTMGYSGFWPPLFWTDTERLLAFPSTATLQDLRGRGVDVVVLHADQFEPSDWEAMQRRLALFGDQLSFVETVDGSHVYALRPAAGQPAALRTAPYLPPTALAGKPYPLFLTVDAPADADSVHLTLEPYAVTYRWTAPDSTLQEGVVQGKLPLVHPAGRSAIPVLLPAPPASGSTLEVALETLGQRSSASAVVTIGDQAPMPPAEGSIAPFYDASMNYDDKLRLSHVALDSASYRAGDAIAVTLNWQKLSEAVTDDYVVFFRIVDTAGQEVFNDNRPPVSWEGTPATWPVDETIVDQYLLQLPLDLAPGAYTLALGLYNVTTQQFVALVNDDGTQWYAAFETKIDVTE